MESVDDADFSFHVQSVTGG